MWFVTDGTAERDGWQGAFVDALREGGAASVDVLGLPAAVGWTARRILEQGAEQVARGLRFLVGGDAGIPAADALRSGRPDLLVVDGPGVTGPLEFLRETMRGRPLTVGLVSRFAPLTAWSGAAVDALVVPHASMVGLAEGVVGGGRVVVAGPPVSPAFLRPHDRAALRTAMGFGEGQHVILVDASTLLPATIDAVVAQWRGVPASLVPLFFHGGEQESAEALREAAAVHGIRAGMFGDRVGLEEVLAAVDAVVVGAGATLLSPCVVTGCPMVALEPRAAIPPLVDDGAMVALSGPMALSSWLAEVAWNGVPDGFRVRAGEVARRGGCAEVVSALAGLIARRAELREGRRSPAPGDGAASGEPTSAPAAGRFEAIGSSPGAAVASPLDRGQAREQMAQLIMEERRLENRLADEIRERDRWMRRRELATEAGDDALASVAEERIRGHAAVVRQLGAELEGVAARRDSVRRRAAGGGGAGRSESAESARGAAEPSEERFRAMEVEDDLERLRRRLREGGGDNGTGER